MCQVPAGEWSRVICAVHSAVTAPGSAAAGFGMRWAVFLERAASADDSPEPGLNAKSSGLENSWPEEIFIEIRNGPNATGVQGTNSAATFGLGVLTVRCWP